MIMKLFSKSMARLEQALNIRSTRHQVITANIANQDTPGYKAKTLDFKSALRSAKQDNQSIRLLKTNSRHIAPTQAGHTTFSEQITLSQTGRSKRLDGNTVNSEKEMTRLAENTFMYQATAQLIAGKFRGLKNVIQNER
ncbi:flagellar basal body rod protein FlgB [Nitrospira defluvii]|nr:flagellar basal body rod protein FlgB [Nitrospira defluvii]